MSTDTVEMLFDLAIQAERAAREFYAGLLHRFDHVPRAAAVWREMMEDEEEQVRFLEEVRARLTPEQLQAPADPEMMRKLRLCLEFSPQDALQRIRTLNDAYGWAHDLEYSEINAVLEFIINEYHLDAAVRTRLVDHYLQKHLKRLLALGGVAWRRSIRAQE